MNRKYKKIILATNGSPSAKPAEEAALQLALRDQAELLIVDTIRLQSRIEKWLVGNSDAMYEMLVREKRDYLDQLKEEFLAKGVERVSTKLLPGKSSEQLTFEVLRNNCDLLIRYRKGSDSRRPGLFGTTAMNLLRICPCPVLLVNKPLNLRSFKVLACVDIHDKDPVNNNIMQAAETIGGENHPIGLLYCWTIFGYKMIRRRMEPESYEQMVDDIRQEREREFDEFLAKHELTRSADVTTQFGDPETVIVPFVHHQSVDVTVMSTIAPTGLASRLLGSTIENILVNLPTNLLAVKPEGFVSPLKLEDDTANAIMVADDAISRAT